TEAQLSADRLELPSTVCRLGVDRLMTLSTSAVAACCSRASISSRMSRTTSVSWPEAAELRWRPAFRGFALRVRALAPVLLALERRRIAHPKAQDYADFRARLQQGFATEMGSDPSFCVATIRGTECPLWVKSGHCRHASECPLYSRKRTLAHRIRMPALCQKL